MRPSYAPTLPTTARDALLLAILLALPFVGLNLAPLFDLDEGAFTASTVEMFLRGDFLSTHLLGEPRHDKPILIYWLQAASISVFGAYEWSFRLPSAIAASLWIGVTYAFARRVLDAEAALTAATVIATAAGLMVIQRAATADAWLNLWLACSGYAAWLWLQEGDRRWHWLGFAAMGLGFLTKGPVAVAIPAATVLLWCASQGEWRRFARWAFSPLPILLLLAIAAPWFALVTMREGLGFLTGFFMQHNVSRFSAPMEGHGGQLWFYLPVLLLSLLPHTGLLFAAFTRLGAAWRAPLLRFGLIWFVLVFALFSLSGTKLPHYLYYGYGGLVLLLAAPVTTLRAGWAVLLPAPLFLALLLALPTLLQQAVPGLKADDRLLADGLATAFPEGYLGALAAALAASVMLLLTSQSPGRARIDLTTSGSGAGFASRGRRLFWPRLSLAHALYAQGLIATACVSLLLMPAVGALLQAPVKAAGLLAQDIGAPLVLNVNTPSFQTYAGRQVVKRAPLPGDVVLTRESRLAALGEADILYRDRGYVLARVLAPARASAQE